MKSKYEMAVKTVCVSQKRRKKTSYDLEIQTTLFVRNCTYVFYTYMYVQCMVLIKKKMKIQHN